MFKPFLFKIQDNSFSYQNSRVGIEKQLIQNNLRVSFHLKKKEKKRDAICLNDPSIVIPTPEVGLGCSEN